MGPIWMYAGHYVKHSVFSEQISKFMFDVELLSSELHRT